MKTLRNLWKNIDYHILSKMDYSLKFALGVVGCVILFFAVLALLLQFDSAYQKHRQEVSKALRADQSAK